MNRSFGTPVFLLKRTFFILKNQGLGSTLQAIKNYIVFLKNRKVVPLTSPVLKSEYFYDFVLDFDGKTTFQEKEIKGKSLVVNWIIPDFSIGSGGHTTIFRVIQGLERRGHTCRIYIMGASQHGSGKNAKKIINKYFLKIDAEVYVGTESMRPSDICMATSWHTAYPLYKVENTKKKMYFVQDFEPMFYPMSSEHLFAEQTYKMGYKCITAGKWLSQKMLSYGARADFFELAYDSETYTLDPKIKKKPATLAFYARQVTPRRGFELGILALKEAKRRMPELEIVFFGWDCRHMHIPFSYKNAGILSGKQLAKMYNEVTVGLVFSLTNYSLLPQEMNACGLPVIDILGENTQAVYEGEYVSLAEPTPSSIADKIIQIIQDTPYQSEVQKKAEEVNEHLTWEPQFDKIEKLLYTL